MTLTRPVLTVSEAAASCLVNPKTITRKLPRLVELGAEKDSTGQWRIPVEALLEVGLKPGKPRGQDIVTGQPEVSPDAVPPEIRAELDALRHERDALLRDLLAAERRTAEAERRATEAQKERAEALAQALDLAQRALPAGRSAERPATAAEDSASSTGSTVEATSTPSPPPAAAPAEPVKRRGWRQWFSG